jgi:hypothetical protein
MEVKVGDLSGSFGSIVDRRHLVNVMLPNDSNDHYSSRSAASDPNGRSNGVGKLPVYTNRRA